MVMHICKKTLDFHFLLHPHPHFHLSYLPLPLLLVTAAGMEQDHCALVGVVGEGEEAHRIGRGPAAALEMELLGEELEEGREGGR